MKNTLDKDYKLMAVNRVKESGKTVTEVARELDLSSNTLHGWINKFGKHGSDAFPGSGHLYEADDELRKLRKEIMDLREENAILKKAAAYFAKNQK
ncbi:transposase [Desulfosporosinus lacus]|uniref:Transposase n=1 Tax=Desulfosporosinus lacus DSM 15449 TaxID=1121420 RepID=A0A1M5ZZC9_9FIRM|nr:transposase [Desulfosporosinus lacus]SHI29263.1 transposase [Desulfosporosinus lacus DSM 15449]